MARKEIEVDEDFLKLFAHVEIHKAPGALLIYSEVEKETGVKMDRQGRDKLREAIIKNGVEYRLVRGEAYQLAEVTSTREILGRKLMSISSRIKRAERARSVLAYHFFKSLPEQEQQRFLLLQSCFGAIQHEADKAQKRLYAKKLPALPAPKIILPIVPDM